MNLVLSDLYAVLVLLPAIIMLLLAALYMERRGQGASQFLNRDEWIAVAKLVAIPLLILILIQAEAALKLRPELFLYGRF